MEKASERQTVISGQNQSSMGLLDSDYPIPTQNYSTPWGVSGYNPRTYFNPNQGGGDRFAPPRVCWRCGEPGHLQYQCANHPPPNFVDFEPTGRVGGVYQSTGRSSRRRAPARVRARINGREIPCLLSTGSNVSVLPSFAVDADKIRPATRGLMVADGSTVPVLGITTASFTTDSYKTAFEAYVSEHVYEAILGTDFLAQSEASFDFAGSRVSFRGRPHSLVDDLSPYLRNRRVKVVSGDQIPACSQKNLSRQVESKMVSDVAAHCVGRIPVSWLGAEDHDPSQGIFLPNENAQNTQNRTKRPVEVDAVESVARSVEDRHDRASVTTSHMDRHTINNHRGGWGARDRSEVDVYSAVPTASLQGSRP